MPFDVANSDTWPRLLRVFHIVTTPRHQGILPISRGAWWRGVNNGTYPAPLRLGAKMVAWKREDVLKICEAGAKRPEAVE
jgi:predicted DNA-binding transcriptional regulator AlpA